VSSENKQLDPASSKCRCCAGASASTPRNLRVCLHPVRKRWSPRHNSAAEHAELVYVAMTEVLGEPCRQVDHCYSLVSGHVSDGAGPPAPGSHTHPPRRCGSSSRRRPGFEDSAGADTRWSSRTLKKVPARVVVSTMSIVGVQGFTAWIIEFGTPSTPDLLPQEPNRQRAQYRFSRRRRRIGSDRVVLRTPRLRHVRSALASGQWTVDTKRPDLLERACCCTAPMKSRAVDQDARTSGACRAQAGQSLSQR
jgi:hypothetical protein